MGWKKGLVKGGKIVAEIMAPDVLNLGVKIGSDIYEQKKNQVKIPDLKDVHIDEALRILKEDLHLIPTKAIANPNIAYADESENEVMHSEPRFGTRVNPGTPVKVYYLTQEVVDMSKNLLGNIIHEFKVPNVIGLNIYEARQDLEDLGLKITEKLEKPRASFANKVDGQVTRITYPNDKKTGTKLKTGERVWIYFVNDDVISESKSLHSKIENDKQEMIDKLGKVTHDVSKGISDGAIDATKSIVQNIGNKFGKNKTK